MRMNDKKVTFLFGRMKDQMRNKGFSVYENLYKS